MKFEKGNPKPANSGRKKGTKNKSSMLVGDIVAKHDLNLVEQVLVRLPKLETYQQVKVMLALMPYVYPKLGAVEHSLVPQSQFLSQPDIFQVKTFSEFCEASNYPKPFPKQEEMRAFSMNETEARLLLGSRGYGKTDYAVCMGIAYELYLEFMVAMDEDGNPGEVSESFLLVTKSTERNAAILGEIQKALVANGVTLEAANQTYLRVAGLQGKEQSVSSVTVGTSSLRGRHPKRTVMEDVVTPEDISPATRKKVKRVYDEVHKLCPNVVVIGQPVHKLDLYETLRPTLKKMEVPHGSIPELDADLEAQRLAGVSEESIQSSYLLNVVSESAFPFETIRALKEMPMGTSVAFLDPSFEGKDLTALSIFKSYFDGIAVQGHVWKRPWHVVTDEITNRLKEQNCKKLCIETNCLGDQPVILFRQCAPQGMGVVGKKSLTNKHSTIMNCGPYAHKIHLSEKSDTEYKTGVRQYEFGSEPDDAPDSLARGLEWMGLVRGKGKTS